MAPELMLENYNHMVDVYSFGMILWEILLGKTVKEGYQKDPGEMYIMRQAMDKTLRPQLDGLNAFGQGVVEMCWETDPEDRGGDFEFLAGYLQTNNYDVLDGVMPDEVEKYVSRIEEYERIHPPHALAPDDEEAF
jgi:serine/threonine protein kinase